MKSFFFTNDVELTSITNNKQSTDTGKLVAERGLPALLDLYAKHSVQSTFFVTGDYAKLYPQSVKQILEYGHGIGSHGLFHEHHHAFDSLTYHQQLVSLQESKSIIEDIIGQPVISFRAPSLRVNRYTPQALLDSGFLIDSSIASQRFDFFMSFGTKSKLNWLFAPRSPYFCSSDDLAVKGNSSLLEIPIISIIYPYIGTTLRISPFLTKLIRQLLVLESSLFDRCIVFIFHPNELIIEDIDSTSLSRRSNNLIKYFLAERFRTYLKRRNLGENALHLLENEIVNCKKHGFNMISLETYYHNFIKGKHNG